MESDMLESQRLSRWKLGGTKVLLVSKMLKDYCDDQFATKTAGKKKKSNLILFSYPKKLFTVQTAFLL